MRILLCLLPLLLCTCDRAQSTQPLPAFGTAASPVRYEKFADVAGLFSQTSDTAYLVNFWATWCQPCREELALLQQLSQRDHARPLRIVLVSLDQDERAIARIPAFLQATAPDLASIILTDPNDDAWGREVDRVWTGSLPTTIIYRGQLRYVYRRAFNTFADLERAVEPLVQ